MSINWNYAMYKYMARKKRSKKITYVRWLKLSRKEWRMHTDESSHESPD